MSIPKIGGRQARELLDGATPGPWQAYDPGDGTARLYGDMNTCHYPDEDEDDRGVRLFHSTNDLVPAHAMVYMERRDGLLAAAAPDLAETVAWLYGREAQNEARTHWGETWVVVPMPDSNEPCVIPSVRHMPLTPDEAVDLARALLAAAEEARA